MRIGHGYDVHRLESGRKLILGGIEIPYEKGLLGHSDADVLVHAIIDSLLGAAGLGDIGGMFPDDDPKYCMADSCVLLKRVCDELYKRRYSIVNIDVTLIAQRPKIKKYIDDMKNKIALSCKIDTDRINIKATTEENL